MSPLFYRSYEAQLPAVTLLKYTSELVKSQTIHRWQDRPAVIDFENSETDGSEYETYTGLSKAQFDEMLPYVQPEMRNSPLRSVRNALGMFLCKLRMGISQERIARLFGIEEQQRVSDAISAVIAALVKNFVPLHLGYDHLSREDLKTHQNDLTSALCNLHDDEVAVIIDGTYIEIEKSANFKFQHHSYSGQKRYNLLKPMAIVAPDGYIVEMESMFYGNNNDASIFNFLLEPNSPFRTMFQGK